MQQYDNNYAPHTRPSRFDLGTIQRLSLETTYIIKVKKPPIIKERTSRNTPIKYMTNVRGWFLQ